MLADSLLDERQPGAEPTAGVVGRATRQGSRASIVDHGHRNTGSMGNLASGAAADDDSG
jgi:hypothetical protein